MQSKLYYPQWCSLHSSRFWNVTQHLRKRCVRAVRDIPKTSAKETRSATSFPGSLFSVSIVVEKRSDATNRMTEICVRTWICVIRDRKRKHVGLSRSLLSTIISIVVRCPLFIYRLYFICAMIFETRSTFLLHNEREAFYWNLAWPWNNL